MIILASASASRRAMLHQAGVCFESCVASVDESAVKDALRLETRHPGQAAECLAELKALRVAERYPGLIVLGADQMLECDGEWFDKPCDRDQARQHLRRLRGKTHRLVSSVVAVRDGERLWHHTEQAQLTMRRFSDAFLENYLEQVGQAIMSCVGAYQLEGPGAQLFMLVEGDYFTILGMPLLAVLDFLRENGELIQ